MKDSAGESRWMSSSSVQVMVVAAIALIAGLPSLPNAFTYDDVALIQDNASLHSLSGWTDVFSTPYWPAPWSRELYRPVMSLVLLLQYVASGGSPLVFRIVSIALYVVASIFVLRLGRRVLPPIAAVIAAMLFAAHPVHVEAVAPAVNQGELIVAILATFSLILFLDRKRTATLRPATWIALTLVTVTAALTKENGFVIPALLLTADLLFENDRPGTAPVRSRWLGYLAVGVACTVVLWIRSRVLGGDVVGTYTAEALVGASFGERALTTLQVVPQWFRLMLWPAHLQIDYSPDELVASTRLGFAEGIGLLLVGASACVAFLLRRRVPVVSFGLTACAFALLPVSNLLVVSSILLAERTLFLPSAFLLLAVVGAATALWRMYAMRQHQMRTVLLWMVPALVVVGTYRSATRQTIWRSQVRLWHAAALEAPKSRRVQAARRDATKALVDDFAPRIANSAEPWRVRRELAALLHAMGDDSAAVDQFRQLVPIHPDRRAATIDLATLLLSFGRYHEARALADTAITHGDSAGDWRRLRASADSALAAVRR